MLHGKHTKPCALTNDDNTCTHTHSERDVFPGLVLYFPKSKHLIHSNSIVSTFLSFPNSFPIISLAYALPFMTKLVSRQDRGNEKKISLVTTLIISTHSNGDVVIAEKPCCLSLHAPSLNPLKRIILSFYSSKQSFMFCVRPPHMKRVNVY